MTDTRYGMVASDFDDALAMLEGLVARNGADESPDKLERHIARVDKSFDGEFRDAYQQYLEDERNRVYDIEIARVVREDGARPNWYDGPLKNVGQWPRYKSILREKIPAALDSVDESTDSILGSSANPKKAGDKRKGLVLGYVQSGKTANYAALIAKAVDAGYRIVIVLAGMHTNLRRQTQSRLENDLSIRLHGHSPIKADTNWWPLTDANADIGPKPNLSGLNSNANALIAVVKKNSSRLQYVVDFLQQIDSDTLSRKPVLIIDDESDQATPNTKSAKGEISAINDRIRDIWAQVVTGTYVAFTATPFANIFINPDDKNDLYPSDFIYSLPEPDNYLGASKFFDLPQNADEDDDVAADSIVISVPEDEASVLVPRGRNMEDYDPGMVPSLVSAVNWFFAATAIRRLRTDATEHSSMLIHTSHRVLAHDALADQLKSYIQRIAADPDAHRELIKREVAVQTAKPDVFRTGATIPPWDEIWPAIRDVISTTKVAIDNGKSGSRLSYPDNEPQTVIAVGGGTLSRGLTLEGLITSYFLRATDNYDSLLQMGRWFGYRPGYSDLVRIWVGPGLLDDFAHLARVEQELRDEIQVLQSENRTPDEFAVKVRAHSGRLKITAANKMVAAKLVSTGLSDSRRQTIYLDKHPEHALAAAKSVKKLVESALDSGLEAVSGNEGAKNSDILLPGLSNRLIVEFFERYWVAPTEPWLQADKLKEWINRYAPESPWNLVIVSGGRRDRHIDVGNGLTVNPVNRAPLKEWSQDSLGIDDLPEGADIVNIRALMSGVDYLADLRVAADAGQMNEAVGAELRSSDSSVSRMRTLRRLHGKGRGMLAIYIVDGQSRPVSPERNVTRTTLEAETDLVGVGVVFPTANDEDPGNFFAVIPRETVDEGSDEDALSPDDEADYEVTQS